MPLPEHHTNITASTTSAPLQLGVSLTDPLKSLALGTGRSRNGLLWTNHCDPSVIRKPVTTEVANLVSRVALQYGVQAGSVTLIDGPAVTAENFLVKSSSGESILVRHCLIHRSPAHAENLLEISRYLADQGVPTPRVLQPLNSEQPLLSFEGRRWIAFPNFPRAGYFGGGSNEIVAVARLVGALHAALRSFEQDRPNSVALQVITQNQIASRAEDFLIPQSRFEAVTALAAKDTASPYHNLFMQHRDAIQSAFAIRDAAFARAGDEREVQLIHSDLQPHNMPFGKTGPFVVDLDGIGRNSVYLDIGFALQRIMRQVCYVVGPAHVQKAGERFLREYAQSTNRTAPLDQNLILGYALERSLSGCVIALQRHFELQRFESDYELPMQIANPAETVMLFKKLWPEMISR